MARLARVIQPTLGIFTTLGTAHDAGFASPEEKAGEKMQLFAQVDTLFYCRDHAAVHAAARALLPAQRRFTWSRQHPHEANVAVTVLEHET